MPHRSFWSIKYLTLLALLIPCVVSIILWLSAKKLPVITGTKESLHRTRGYAIPENSTYITTTASSSISNSSSTATASPLATTLVAETANQNRQSRNSSGLRWKIHFVYTSARAISGKLPIVFECALFAALRHAAATHSEIILHLPGYHSAAEYTLPLGLQNVTLSFVGYAALFNGTPLLEWYLTPNISQHEFYEFNLGNAYRLALLWREGGTYLDLDMIAVRPELLASCDAAGAVAKEKPGQLNGAFLSFPAGSNFIMESMKSFVLFYQPVWGNNGPQVVSRVCYGADSKGEHYGSHHSNATRCPNPTLGESSPVIHSYEQVYGFSWQERGRLNSTTPQTKNWWAERQAWGAHFFHHALGGCFRRKTLFFDILREACPTVDVSSFLCTRHTTAVPNTIPTPYVT